MNTNLILNVFELNCHTRLLQALIPRSEPYGARSKVTGVTSLCDACATVYSGHINEPSQHTQYPMMNYTIAIFPALSNLTVQIYHSDSIHHERTSSRLRGPRDDPGQSQ
jgi:hypothetical protein